MKRLTAAIHSLIGWLERRTGIDLRYVISGSFFLNISQIASAIGTLILAIGFAHFVSKDTYGTYKYVLSIAALLNSFTLGGLTTSVLRSSAAGYQGSLPQNAKRYLRYGIVVLVVGCGLAIYYALRQNGAIAFGVALASCALPLIGATGLFDSYLQGTRRFRVSAMISIALTIFQTAALFACILLGATIAVLITVYFLTLAIGTSGAYLFVMRSYDIRDDGHSIPEDHSFGLHLSAQSIITAAAAQVDQILIFHLFGAAALALYAFAIAIPEQSKGFIKNFNNLALARYAGSVPSRSSLLYKTFLLAVFVTVCVVLYIIVAPFIFSFLFPAYRAAVPYSQAYALSLIFVSSVLPQAALQARNDTRGLYYTTIVGAVGQTVGILGLGLLFGIWGVVAGRILGRFITLLITLVWVQREEIYAV